MASGEVYVIPAEAFTTGSIGGRTVACVSAEQQFLDHEGGYDLDETDHEDMRKLREFVGASRRPDLEVVYAALADDDERTSVIDATWGKRLPRRFSGD